MSPTALRYRPLVAALPLVPRGLVERAARRYVAGGSFAEAAAVAAALDAGGRLVTYDVLGEGYHRVERVDELVQQYLEILAAPQAYAAGPPTLSVMMTGLGLDVDPDLCRSNLRRLAAEGDAAGRALTINMEDHTTTDATLAAYRELRAAGHDGVGLVLQAALRRTLADVRALAPLAPRVRVVKGVWVEPAAVAYHDFDVIRTRYLHVVDRLLDAGSYVELATHDELLVAECLERVDRRGLPPGAYEFQLLLGVRPDLADVLHADGHRVRVYVPFGRDWYAYCLRRLRESPQVAAHVVRDGVARAARRIARRA